MSEFLKKMIQYTIDRLGERTTWLGIAGALALLVGKLNPDMENAIVTAGMAIMSVIAMVLRDKKVITEV